MAISRLRRIAAASCLLIGLCAASFFGVHLRFSRPQSAARIGATLPQLTVDDAGRAVDLKELAAGRRCVIVFFSPACRSCRDELPFLQPFPPSLRLILVREPGPQDTPDALRLPEATLVYDRWSGLSRSFAIAVIPAILFVDERGILRDGLVGSHRRELVQGRLRAFAGLPE